jgi:predicted RNA-binding protein YlqC (UPF0109 family)
LEALITYIARALVDRPEEVALRASEVDGAKLFELKVAPEDVGKVIGRDGRTVNAIRTLLSAAAQREGARARLEIVDDRRGSQSSAPAIAPNAPATGAPPDSAGQ